MKLHFNFLSNLIRSRYLVYELTKRNVTNKYRKSKLGMFWALAEPLAFMGVLYLVFGIGLRGGRSMGIPFICYLASGMAAVNFFTSVLTQGTISVRTSSYLLKKVNFRIGILPLVTVFSGVIDHLLFLVAVLLIVLINGILPNFYWFQLIYYILANSIFLAGITWFTASVGVFLPDLQHITSVIGRMIFYFSPVMWNHESIPESLHFYVRLNPLFYIVTGYRDSLFYSIPFWDKPELTLYFWLWVIVMLFLGTFFFKRLSPQFVDHV